MRQGKTRSPCRHSHKDYLTGGNGSSCCICNFYPFLLATIREALILILNSNLSKTLCSFRRVSYWEEFHQGRSISIVVNCGDETDSFPKFSKFLKEDIPPEEPPDTPISKEFEVSVNHDIG